MKIVYCWRAGWVWEHPIRGRSKTFSDGGPYETFASAFKAMENAIADKPSSRVLTSKKISQHEVGDDTRTIEYIRREKEGAQ